MQLMKDCPRCKAEGYTVRLPLQAYTHKGENFLGYTCHVCGNYERAEKNPYPSIDQAKEDLSRIVWESHREIAQIERKYKNESN